MYLICLLFICLISAYVYHTYLPYFIDVNESVFIVLMCGLFSLLYLLFNRPEFQTANIGIDVDMCKCLNDVTQCQPNHACSQ